MDKSLVNSLDKTDFGENNTPLHYAAYNGWLQLIELLIESGSDVNARNATGCTALFMVSIMLLFKLNVARPVNKDMRR